MCAYSALIAFANAVFATNASKHSEVLKYVSDSNVSRSVRSATARPRHLTETIQSMNQQTQTSNPQQPSPLLVARVLTMVLENGIALAMRRTRPHSIAALNGIRTQLLQDSFFDEAYRTDELAPRTRPSRILFMDLVVLMAKLQRVLMRQAPLTEDEMAERINVRNECLIQPFFDRRRANSARPFVDDDDFEDEGVFV